MQLPIYLDYASTTPVDPRVVKKMQEGKRNEACVTKNEACEES